MKLHNLFLLSILILCGKNLYSQTFEVPANYEFKVAADYARYEKDIIEASKWLKSTPINEQSEKRKEVSAFVVMD